MVLVVHPNSAAASFGFMNGSATFAETADGVVLGGEVAAGGVGGDAVDPDVDVGAAVDGDEACIFIPPVLLLVVSMASKMRIEWVGLPAARTPPG
jgi:hypothetical protein